MTDTVEVPTDPPTVVEVVTPGAAGAPGIPGPAGADSTVPGPEGPEGPAGPQGIPGTAGGAGPQGEQGEQGPQGIPGVKGDTGDTGAAGAPGGAGPQGVPGAPGADGADGADGATGPEGPQGEVGPAGEQGEIGPQGDPGPEGPAGADGAAGPAGDDGAAGAAGADGAAGPAGLTWQGAWGAAVPYAINDTVTRLGSTYRARRVHTGTDPAAATVETLSALHYSGGLTDTQAAGYAFVQRFTPSTDMYVDRIKLGQYNAAWTGMRVGIADDAPDGTAISALTFRARSVAVTTSTPVAGDNEATFDLTSETLLTAGTPYLVVFTQTVSTRGPSSDTSLFTRTGLTIASGDFSKRAAVVDGTTASTGQYFKFKLYSRGVMWDPLAVKGDTGANGTNGAAGADGDDGIGVTDVEVDGSGHLIVTLTDASEIDAGALPSGYDAPPTFYDLFDRVTSGTVGTADSGQVWDTTVEWECTGTALKPLSSGFRQIGIEHAAFRAGVARVTMEVAPTDEEWWFTFLMSPDNASYVRAGYSPGAGKYLIQKIVSGGLGTFDLVFAGADVVPADGDELHLEWTTDDGLRMLVRRAGATSWASIFHGADDELLGNHRIGVSVFNAADVRWGAFRFWGQAPVFSVNGQVGAVVISGGFTRTTAVKTTGSLADAAREAGTVTMTGAAAFRVYKLETDVPARVRLYTTTAKRDADLARAVGVDPTGDHGLLLDVVTTTGVLSLELSPLIDGYLPGTAGTVPITVDNLSGSTDTVTATLTYVRTE